MRYKKKRRDSVRKRESTRKFDNFLQEMSRNMLDRRIRDMPHALMPRNGSIMSRKVDYFFAKLVGFEFHNQCGIDYHLKKNILIQSTSWKHLSLIFLSNLRKSVEYAIQKIATEQSWVSRWSHRRGKRVWSMLLWPTSAKQFLL